MLASEERLWYKLLKSKYFRSIESDSRLTDGEYKWNWKADTYSRLLSYITPDLRVVRWNESTDPSVKYPQSDSESNSLPSENQYNPLPHHSLIGLPRAR
jgi:hypothetical protein